ncbi:MAG: hypothetical protein ACYTG0_44745, partial [Planctomycetota bacterium]
MRKLPLRAVGVIVLAGLVFTGLTGACGETVNLDLKKLEPLQMSGGRLPADFLFRMAKPQQFTVQLGAQPQIDVLIQGADPPKVKPFSEVISKEPAKYQSEEPIRAVAKLGSGEYGFVLDLVPPKPKAKADATDSEEEAAVEEETESTESKGYAGFHFDRNGNGDLTDDEVILGKPPSDWSARGYWWCQFPRVDLKIDVDGKKVDYAFFFTAGTGTVAFGGSESMQLVSAGLVAAAYREGEITLGGKKTRVVVLDFNSNGRFDDKGQIRQVSRGRASATYGDLLLIDPASTQSTFPMNYSDLMENQVAKVAHIGGDLYGVDVSPGGDTLKLTP